MRISAFCAAVLTYVVIGPWPRVLGLVNAPIEWGGTTWVSFNWDFVAGLASPRGRRELFIHEMFHRVQPGLGLMQLAAANEHVDAMDGRYWLRLEPSGSSSTRLVLANHLRGDLVQATTK